jgi:putative transport protein
VQWLIESFRQHQEIALFLVLALGYGLGELRIGTFKVGPVLGVLIAGIAVGQLKIPVSDALRNAFFMLSLFAIGYRAGPQFFQSLRATPLKQIGLTIVVGATAFALSLTLARLVGFDAHASWSGSGGLCWGGNIHPCARRDNRDREQSHPRSGLYSLLRVRKRFTDPWRFPDSEIIGPG